VKPYYEDAASGIAIYHGDCREILPSIKADVVVTDPPYGIGFSEYESHVDTRESYQETLRGVWLAEAAISNGWCVVYQSATTARDWATWFQRAWRILAIPKTFTQVHPGAALLWATDYALFWPVGTPTWPEKGSRPRDWYLAETSDMSQRVKGHPCPRPLNAVRYIVNGFSAPDTFVLDPFMGSGTTLVAAKLEGRRAIGIEIEEKYCEIAARRLAQGVLPFSEVHP